MSNERNEYKVTDVALTKDLAISSCLAMDYTKQNTRYQFVYFTMLYFYLDQ